MNVKNRTGHTPEGSFDDVGDIEQAQRTSVAGGKLGGSFSDKKRISSSSSFPLSVSDLSRTWQRQTTAVRYATIVIVSLATLFMFYSLYLHSFDVKQVEVDLLACTHRIFTQHNITYFLDYGSLLGAIRHKGFIPWDDMDIDIGVIATDSAKINALKQTFSDPNNYCGHMIHRSDVAHLPSFTSFVIRRGAFRIFPQRFVPYYVDVADYEVKNVDGKTVLYDLEYPELSLEYPLEKIAPVVPCEFEGLIVNCPRDHDFVLTKEFGADWRVPKKNFKPDMVNRENPAMTTPH
ncbi:LicD [Balamuthia mandrillaris]